MNVLSHIFLNPVVNVFHNCSIFQVVIGRPDKQEVHTSNHIEVGTMVADYLAKYAGEWPQIGKKRTQILMRVPVPSSGIGVVCLVLGHIAPFMQGEEKEKETHDSRKYSAITSDFTGSN